MPARPEPMIDQILQFLLTGVTVGATYALVALGFAIIYNASDVINFAQGEFVMMGAMSAIFLSAGNTLKGRQHNENAFDCCIHNQHPVHDATERYC